MNYVDNSGMQKNPVNLMIKIRDFRYAKGNKADGFKAYYLNYIKRESALSPLSGYIHQRYGATGVFDMNGKDINKTTIEAIKKSLVKSQGIVWDIVISFDTQYALDHHLTNPENAKACLENYLSNLMLRHVGIEQSNLESFFSFHTNTDNPHIQGIIFEKKSVRKNPKLDLAAINHFKNNLNISIRLHQQEFQKTCENLLSFEKKSEQKLIDNLTKYLDFQHKAKLEIPAMCIKEYFILNKLNDYGVKLPSGQMCQLLNYSATLTKKPSDFMKKLIWKEFIQEPKVNQYLKEYNLDKAKIKQHQLYYDYEKKYFENMNQEILNHWQKFIVKKEITSKTPYMYRRQEYLMKKNPARGFQYQKNNKIQKTTQKILETNTIYHLKKVDQQLEKILGVHNKNHSLEQVRMLEQIYQQEKSLNYELERNF